MAGETKSDEVSLDAAALTRDSLVLPLAMQLHLTLELAAPMKDAQAIQVPEIDACDPMRFASAESQDD